MKKLMAALVMMGSIGVSVITFMKGRELYIKEKQRADKNSTILRLLHEWLLLKQNGKSVAAFFQRNDYRTIAIYGMGHVGQCLYSELKNSDIEVRYVIDKNAGQLRADVNILTPEDNLMEVDAIIVTVTYLFDEIEQILSKKVNVPILSIEEVLSEIW